MIDSTPLHFFTSIPDETLAQIAIEDWESLERLCIALSIDLQEGKEKVKRNLC